MMQARDERSMVRPTDRKRRSRFVQALAFSHSTSVSPAWRRVMTISVYALMWGLLTTLAPIWLPVAIVMGSFRRKHFIVLRLLAFFWVYFSVELLGLLAAGTIYLITPGNVPRRRDLFFHLSCRWGSTLFAWICRLLSLSASIEGQEHVLPAPVLVFIRHASIIDTLLPVTFISKPNGLQLRYVLKRELLVDPCVDVAGHVWPNYFIDRGGSPAEEIAGVRRLAADLGDQGVLLYPEGTRFTEHKKKIALERLQKQHPELVAIAQSYTHCLPPKTGGALALLDDAPHTDVLIVAHRGLEGFAEIADLFSGTVVGKSVEIRIWRVSARTIPNTKAERERWLFDWWKRVDDFVSSRD
ncbi:MAG: 1-acyl-sn-glycerol-3-phosphate acyltransferase [Myxococcales bacterium]|jgi:1-acyl-sn-glycerol-3-phosphate acyltransferase